MSTNNVLSPSNGKPLMTPTQDMVLGLYWITRETEGVRGENKIFSNRQEVVTAYDHGKVDLHAKIHVRLNPGEALVANRATNASHSENALPWEPFHPDLLDELVKQNTVLVDFTADW